MPAAPPNHDIANERSSTARHRQADFRWSLTQPRGPDCRFPRSPGGRQIGMTVFESPVFETKRERWLGLDPSGTMYGGGEFSRMGDEIPVGQLIGYAPISTAGQDLALQRDALERAGCDRIYDDTGSGSIRHRPQLDACLDYLRAGDTLVVWRLDRLGRSLRHLIETIGTLEQREIGFRSLTEGLDTTTAAGRLTHCISSPRLRV
jgi:hypothetical protein